MANRFPSGARDIVLALGRGARCYTRSTAAIDSAYLEQHGRITPIDLQELHGLVVAGYLRAKRHSGPEQQFTMTAKGRSAYRALTRPSWYRWLPWTPQQRLQLAILPVCFVCGMMAQVMLSELAHWSDSWTRIGSTGAMLLPLLLVFLWQRWHGA